MQSRLVRALFGKKGEYWFDEVIWADESGSFSLSNSAGTRGGELGVLRVREHPLSKQVHPLVAKSTLLKQMKNIIKYHLKPISNKDMVIKA